MQLRLITPNDFEPHHDVELRATELNVGQGLDIGWWSVSGENEGSLIHALQNPRPDGEVAYDPTRRHIGIEIHARVRNDGALSLDETERFECGRGDTTPSELEDRPALLLSWVRHRFGDEVDLAVVVDLLPPKRA